ncbi:uncharacterized protein LOC115621482 [Scaptodrosophila lebanonensis]|uniref:Uncharacterized protein LOC115621482 n=1 Tax=Drosophila lebanonensis TaxID=7225 RepID=A0A6J2T7S8_DROLE|nr:uncharacterized protein LOC115621482 [Scaptodrosophila lebanonensis]
MFFYWCLISLVTGYGYVTNIAVEAATTTEHPNVESNRIITERLKELPNNPEGHTQNNAEYNDEIRKVIMASKKSINFLEEKVAVYERFLAYNRRRLDLEHEIEDRIKVLNYARIPNYWPGSYCLNYYLAQRVELEGAYQRSNAVKEQKIKNNIIDCVEPDYEYEYV